MVGGLEVLQADSELALSDLAPCHSEDFPGKEKSNHVHMEEGEEESDH